MQMQRSQKLQRQETQIKQHHISISSFSFSFIQHHQKLTTRDCASVSNDTEITNLQTIKENAFVWKLKEDYVPKGNDADSKIIFCAI